ncbi:selenocysteine-specific elongation factor [bacterium BMS3Abin02]|nr:selenocysteine-specific elongation factor [bacterium BMS3Abin02]HDL50195.1 selenocysteine-specific translation elongation factor [Actinomycetota bacterium]
MPVIGTAGHVDHGKSTLIQALTGRDPDRWEEEKLRGLTIDLGFAWTTLPDGTEVSFVDVPGHQRFIKNMLSGIEAIDVALFVVAADEGWMPQSEEHLAVLDLLGVRHGVVAITKTDRVDSDLVTLAALEVEDRLEGTTLEGSTIVPVAPPTGLGVAALEAALVEAVGAATRTFCDGGQARMWIDRSFTIAGSGTVVTGTLLDGPLSVDDKVMLWPGRISARIRSLQSHERSHTTIQPHTRAAANLVGIDHHEVSRGAMLGAPDAWSTTRRFLASIDSARYVEEPLTAKGAFHLHLGSGTRPVRLRPLGGTGILGSSYALLSVDEPVVVKMGDRFIIREVGRRQVVAGGRVLDPDPAGRDRDTLATGPALSAVLDRSPAEMATALLQARGTDEIEHIARHTGGGTPIGLLAGGLAISNDTAHDLIGRISHEVQTFHGDNPLRPGLPKADLASRLGVSVTTLDALIALSSAVRDDGPVIAAITFSPAFGPAEDAARTAVIATLESAGLTVPRVQDLEIDRELLHALLRGGDLIQVSEDLVFLPAQIDTIRTGLTDLPNPFTVAEFRDRFEISRKYAVPLLEWLDAAAVTKRSGNVRTY